MPPPSSQRGVARVHTDLVTPSMPTTRYPHLDGLARFERGLKRGDDGRVVRVCHRPEQVAEIGVGRQRATEDPVPAGLE